MSVTSGGGRGFAAARRERRYERGNEFRQFVRSEADPPFPVVDQPVMVAAEQHQVVELGFAVFGLRVQVVGVAPVKRFLCHIGFGGWGDLAVAEARYA